MRYVDIVLAFRTRLNRQPFTVLPAIPGMAEPPVYVGLTTLPSRIGRCRDTLESLLSQTIVPDRIFVSIPDRSMREGCGYDVPEWMTRDLSPRVEVVRCSQDYGPGTKVLGCLPRISRSGCLIVVDDDLKYSPTVVERLFEAQMRDHRSSFSFFVYRLGPFPIGQGADGFSFYTPNLAGIEEFARAALRNPALFVTDDLWISLFLRNKGIRVRSLRFLLGPDESVYAQTYDRPNQLRHLSGELQRHAAMSAGMRYLVRSGLLRSRLRVEYRLWRVPGFSFCEYWLRRLLGPVVRWARAILWSRHESDLSR